MGRVKKQRIKGETKDRPLTSTLTLEERLKVLTNLIVDRLIEDQINGNLRFKTKETKL
jgi:hypothetical protein